MLTCPAVGAVHERATQALESDGGISSKLLTKPEAAPPEVHSWSSDSTAVHAERFVQVEPSVLDWYDHPCEPWVLQLNPSAPYHTLLRPPRSLLSAWLISL
jgi:hypothetical protein